MNKIQASEKLPKTYYIHGSGLMGVPSARVNEIPRLKAEFHAGESKRALEFARMKKVA